MNKEFVQAVCIDDFALKKRQRYGTIMVDLISGDIVDMIESREKDDVATWLLQYPNIAVVSRDGSHTYAQAITKAFPKVIQVSDRFHILKNLNERATQVFQRLFQGRIAIPITDETARLRTTMRLGSVEEKALSVKQLRALGCTAGEIGATVGLPEDTVKKYLSGNIREPVWKTGRGREHENAVRKRQERAERVRKLKAEGLSLADISRETGFTYDTITKYLSDDFTPVNAHYGKQREGKLEPFREEVLRMYKAGLRYREIHAAIKQQGYYGSQDAIRGFISKERRISQDMAKTYGETRELIDKKWLIRLLYKPLSQVKGISKEQFYAVLDAYPIAAVVYDIVYEFQALMRSRKPERLFKWIESVTAYKIAEIDAFVAGLRKDIDAVTNSVQMDCSNGLAEGSVNKVKVIKRVMYGRCSFAMLKSKVLLLEQYQFN